VGERSTEQQQRHIIAATTDLISFDDLYRNKVKKTTHGCCYTSIIVSKRWQYNANSELSYLRVPFNSKCLLAFSHYFIPAIPFSSECYSVLTTEVH